MPSCVVCPSVCHVRVLCQNEYRYCYCSLNEINGDGDGDRAIDLQRQTDIKSYYGLSIRAGKNLGFLEFFLGF